MYLTSQARPSKYLLYFEIASYGLYRFKQLLCKHLCEGQLVEVFSSSHKYDKKKKRHLLEILKKKIECFEKKFERFEKK